MKFSLEQVAVILNGEIVGDSNKTVHTISNIEEAKEGSITFLSNPKYEPFIYQTKASAVIVNDDFEPKEQIKPTLIKVKNAYSSFTALLEEYQKIINFQKVGIEQPSFIAETATYGDQLYLGAFAYLGNQVKIGKNVKIYPQVYLGDNVEIGDNTILYSGVKIYANCKVGSHCTIQSGAVIGSDGFGFAPQEDGTYKTIPQVGNVILKDHVDVGANTTIDCATFDSTIIENGVKLDNLIQIAHNVEIGENTVIASQSGVSGSTKVGKQVIIAGQVGLVGHIKIGDHNIIAAQSGVSKNTPNGVTIMGSPAFDKNDYVKSLVVFKKLPAMWKKVNELEEKILNLPTEN